MAQQLTCYVYKTKIMNAELKKRQTDSVSLKNDRSPKTDILPKGRHTPMKNQSTKHTYGHIMLIDDNDLDNFINEKLMELNHFSKKVYVNTSAISALEFFNNLVAMQDKWAELVPEIVFIDINMPMMDGFQFIELFKKTFGGMDPQPRLVMLTSSLYAEDKMRAESLSKNILFLNKPLTKEILGNI